ncbi:DHA2 family efflux MFS transporter permease subunit [Runella sp.]|jgi:DHA2 family multidrug resistance protein|uniref:DHA2 family efflux MFS transporter permease subunit n=1 Tax=Runella sp. TaxID=1960881 RepID=UPI002626BD1F|nr:DHA2 family efflux MFS transporter permease subunit [Runella sp.]
MKRWIVVITVITAAVMELIDTSIVNVGLYQMAGNLGVTIEDISWVITAYAIANVIVIPMTGFLQSYFGRKNYFIASIALFTFASYLCGVADTLPLLVIARFLQGIGGGALLSVSQGLLFDSFPVNQRPIASAVFGMGIVMGPTFGPTLGGMIIDNYHWSWMFYINIPVGIVALILSYLYIDKKPEEYKIDRSKIRIDYLGIVLLAVGVGCLQFVLERGEANDWFEDQSILICTILLFISLTTFIWWELKIDNPVVNLRVLKNRNLAIGSILIFVIGIGLFTSVFMYPLFVQRILGFTASQTGLLLIPGGAVTLLVFPIVGRLISKGVPPRYIATAGYIAFATFCYMMSTFDLNTSTGIFLVALIIRGVGLAMSNVPLINQSISTLTPKEMPMGIAITNMIRQIGGAVGVALVNTYIAQRLPFNAVNLSSHLQPGDMLTQERITTMSQSLISRGINPLDALQLAYGNMNIIIQKQALMLSYLDVFQMATWFFIFTFPLLFLLERKKTDLTVVKAASDSAH